MSNMRLTDGSRKVHCIGSFSQPQQKVLGPISKVTVNVVVVKENV